jgi:hypothetical protein
MMTELLTQCLLWAAQNVLNILPIIGTMLILRSLGQHIDLIDILSDGQLCLISTTLSASSLFELMRYENLNINIRIIYTFVGTVIICLSVFIYSHITTQRLNGNSNKSEKKYISKISLGLGLASIFFSFFSRFIWS